MEEDEAEVVVEVKLTAKIRGLRWWDKPDGGCQSSISGDVYDSLEDFIEHQLSRDLQSFDVDKVEVLSTREDQS